MIESYQHVKIDDQVIENDDYFAVIAPAWFMVEIADEEAPYKKSLERLSLGQIHLVTTSWHISELCNGGHYQFYTNGTGIVWREALAGYRALGLDELADILQDAVDRYGGNLSLDRTERENLLDSKDYDLRDLDDRFFEIYKSRSLDQIMLQYIRDNRAEFYFEGKVPNY